MDLLTDPDPATLYAALDAPDPPGAAQYLTDLALRSGAQTAGPEALRRVYSGASGEASCCYG